MRLLIIIALLGIFGYLGWTVLQPMVEKLIKDKEQKEQQVNG